MTEKIGQKDADVHTKQIYSGETEGSLFGLMVLT